ncbi:hypothetical protein HGRIS_012637 [Hohenbuehelia grisea]|uniref:tRNA-5-taurinomethyluridine 2-sulfurtransferase n=1 Tax=Hohenbuehelia grisea TaxID=104357 RepID=A0ABR3ISY3_9AGAR
MPRLGHSLPTDLSREYWLRVFEPSLRLWESGVTPNPDVWCNREIKFGALLDRLPSDLENSLFATGHYARRVGAFDRVLQKPRPQLHRAIDRVKDQSFYLSSIREPALSRTLFPIGHLQKSEVRELARKYQLPTAERQESMGLCFVGERGRFNKFLGDYIQPKPGPFIALETGKIVAQHDGLWNYTIGEKKNAIYVVPGTDHPALWCTSLIATGWNWIWADSPPNNFKSLDGLRARVMFRHRMLDVAGTIRRLSDHDVSIVFDERQKAVAPGQVVAVWDGDWCLGCGTIVEGFQDEAIHSGFAGSC